MRDFHENQCRKVQIDKAGQEAEPKRAGVKQRVMMIAGYLVLCSAIPVFADIANAGENLSNVIIQQGGAIALAVIVFVLIKFLVKKAWVQAGAFLVIGGLMLYFIFNPSSLVGIGQSLYNIVIGGN